MGKVKLSFFGKSDTGRIRTNNEDAWVAQTLWDENTVLAIAIDGVGGYEGGEVAADIARKTIPEYLSASSNGERIELLKQAVTAANNAIVEAKETQPEFSQMSCVLTAAIIDVAQRQISMAHVGDSRLYSFHHGELKKLSHDHSLIGYREEIGDLTEEEAMHHPQRNVIGRDVGSERHKANDAEFIESQVFPLLPNTTLLFCSDGLTDMITSSTIRSVLSKKQNLEEKTDALINAALEAGGKDNVTVVLVEFQADEPVEEPAESVTISHEQEPQEEPETNSQPNTIDPIPVQDKPKKKTWPTTVAYLVIGLAIGFLFPYLRMSNQINALKKEKAELEQQKGKLLDSIQLLLQNEVDSLNFSTDDVDMQFEIGKAIQQNEELKNKASKLQEEVKDLTESCSSALEQNIKLQKAIQKQSYNTHNHE